MLKNNDAAAVIILTFTPITFNVTGFKQQLSWFHPLTLITWFDLIHRESERNLPQRNPVSSRSDLSPEPAPLRLQVHTLLCSGKLSAGPRVRLTWNSGSPPAAPPISGGLKTELSVCPSVCLSQCVCVCSDVLWGLTSVCHFSSVISLGVDHLSVREHLWTSVWVYVDRQRPLHF